MLYPTNLFNWAAELIPRTATEKANRISTQETIFADLDDEEGRGK